MGKLIYSAIASLDGYIEDERGTFDWAVPDDEVHTFINELERPIGTYLYGRRMYETMVVWESVDDQLPAIADYAEIWRAADKIVYSRTLESVSSARTRIEGEFDPEAVRRLKGEGDVSVGGPALAAEAIRARLVDEYRLFLVPFVVGGGKRLFLTASESILSYWRSIASRAGSSISATGSDEFRPFGRSYLQPRTKGAPCSRRQRTSASSAA